MSPRPFALTLAVAVMACSSSSVDDTAEGDAINDSDANDSTDTNNDAAGDSTDATSDADTATTSDAVDSHVATGDLADSSTPSLVEQSRYEADLTFIAAPRLPPSDHWKAVQDLCAERFAANGFEVLRQDYGSGVNVIGALPGTTRGDEFVVVGAHYDSTANCAGADDNGSGVAGVLEASRILGAESHERTLVVVCWDEEEYGLKGSRAFAVEQLQTNIRIVVVYDLEMIGYRDTAPDSQLLPDGMELLFPNQVAAVTANDSRGDFIALVVDDNPIGLEAASAMAEAAHATSLETVLLPVPSDLKNSEVIGVLRRSDHATFWVVDVPAILITDTANLRYSGYHCADGDDTPDRLDHLFATDVIRATISSARQQLRAPTTSL